MHWNIYESPGLIELTAGCDGLEVKLLPSLIVDETDTIT